MKNIIISLTFVALITIIGCGRGEVKTSNTNGGQRIGASSSQPPSTPELLEVRAVSSTQIKVIWRRVSGENISINILRSREASRNFVPAGSQSNDDEPEYDDLNVQAATTYFYKLVATNGAGSSDESRVKSATTGFLPTVRPMAPTILSFTASETSITLSIQDRSNNETGFRIFRRPAGGMFPNDANPTAIIGANDETILNPFPYTDPNLSADTPYDYQIKAFNQMGASLASNIINAKTAIAAKMAPPAPSNLTAQDPSTSTIKLTWRDNSSGLENESIFRLRRREVGTSQWIGVSSNGVVNGRVPANTTSYTDRNLAPNTNYEYRIRAENSVANSAYDGPNANSTERTLQVSVTTFMLNVTASGNGNITSNVGGINCGTKGSKCSASYNEDDEVILTPSPDSGFFFNGWTGCDNVNGNVCTMTMDKNESVAGSFQQNAGNTFTLAVSASGNGNITSNIGGINCGSGCSACIKTYNEGDMVTLMASPNSGSTFSAWTGCDSASGNQCVMTMDKNENVVGAFQQSVNTFTLAVSASGNGNITSNIGGINCGSGGGVCIKTFNENATVTLTAEPDSGSSFQTWTGCDSASGNQCVMTMDRNESVNGTFQPNFPNTFTLNVTASGNGNITCKLNNQTVSCNRTYNEGDIVTLTAIPDQFYAFSIWTGCDGPASSNPCVMTMDKNENVDGLFVSTVGMFTLTVVKGSNGSGLITSADLRIKCGSGFNACSASYVSGRQTTLTATPDAGSLFQNWVGCDNIRPNRQCIMTMNNAKTLTGNFIINPLQLTLSVSTSGIGSGIVTSSDSRIRCGSGFFSCSAVYNEGDDITLTATPDFNNTFFFWTCPGGIINGNQCTVTMVDAGVSVDAAFTTGGLF